MLCWESGYGDLQRNGNEEGWNTHQFLQHMAWEFIKQLKQGEIPFPGSH